MRPIEGREDIERGLDWLCAADPRLAPVRAKVEAIRPVPLRLDRGGFVPLVETVCAQQLSRASADAIFGRLTARLDPLTPQSALGLDEAGARAVGLSRPKLRTIHAVARSIVDGTLDLSSAERMPVEDAMAHICAVPGLGPWTAGVYLLFCAGHPDILPAKDVALQWSASDVLGRGDKLSERELDDLALAWSPWRGVAARLLWANYAVLKGREVLP